MFNSFKKNLQKRLEEYQHQVMDVNTKNVSGKAGKNVADNGVKNTPNQSPRRSSMLSVMVWSMAFALLINYFFIDKSVDKNSSVKENVGQVKFIKRNDIVFVGSENFLMGNLNANGVLIDDVLLGKHQKDIKKNSGNVAALSPVFNKDGIKNDFYSFVKTGFENSAENKFYMPLPDENTKWKYLGNDKNLYKFSWNNGYGLTFKRTFNFENGYVFSVADEVVNSSKRTVELYPYKMMQQAIDLRTVNSSSFAGAVFISGDKVEEIKYKTIESKGLIHLTADKNSVVGWTDNYFANAVITDKPVNVIVAFNKNLSEVKKDKDGTKDIKNFQIFLKNTQPITVKPASSISYTTNIFSGAKNVGMLEKYATQFSIPKMKMMVDYGSFFFIARPATALLRWLNSSFGNMGIAIILFAVIMKILLIPLSLKQMKMTYKMRLMAPELKRIQTYYSDNKFQMQMQMAMLYKKYKINPLSSFMQLLVQIPIFLALWRALAITVEMRHSSFLWISDLTARDPLFILPVLMGVTMWLQMRLQNPTSGDDTNPMAKATKYMPYIMPIMFAMLPSGLILYYVIGNVLGIAQQEIANKIWQKRQ